MHAVPRRQITGTTSRHEHSRGAVPGHAGVNTVCAVSGHTDKRRFHPSRAG